jgi:ATP-dependent DNA helicase PIF1
MGKTATNVMTVKGTGNIINTPLQEILRIKIDAKVMLTYNLDVSDGLTNGAFGTIFGIEEDSRGEVSNILVEFSNPLCGAEMRHKTGYNIKYPDKKVTPINKIEFPYRGKSKVATGTVVQFPLRLAFGSTCHKIQGLTVTKPKKVVVDLNSAFGEAQAYVMLSRVQDISQILIFGKFEKSKIYHCPRALKETNRIKESSQDTFVPNNTGDIVLSSLNIRSLSKNYDLLQKQQKNLSKEFIILQETWISGKDSNTDHFKLPGMKFCHNSIGNGKGVAAFLREEYTNSKNINDQLYQISVYKSSKATIINVYKSSGCDENKFASELSNIIEHEEINAEVFISGDFNFCFLNEPMNKIKLCLENYNFEQIVKKSTHEAGRLLDQVYVKNAKNKYTVIHQSLFLLDHDIMHVVKKQNIN